MRLYKDRQGRQIQQNDIVFYPKTGHDGDFTRILLIDQVLASPKQGYKYAFGIPTNLIEGDVYRNPRIRPEHRPQVAAYRFDQEANYQTYRAGDQSQIIGIAGLKGSGKTTAAQYFVHNAQYQVASFAGPLKAALEPILDSADFQKPYEWSSETFKMLKVPLPPVNHPAVYLTFCRMAGMVDAQGVPFDGDIEGHVLPFAGRDRDFKFALNHFERMYKEHLENKIVTVRFALQIFGTELGRGLSPYIWLRALCPLLESPRVLVDDVRFRNESQFLKNRGAKIVGIQRPSSGSIDMHQSEREMVEDWDQIVDVTLVNDGSITDMHRKIQEHI